MATAWKGSVGTIGAIIAIIGQFWGAGYYLPLIGGVLALIASLGMFGTK